MSQLHSGCLAGTNAAVNREYCKVYNTWNELYTRKTKMEELKLNNGSIDL